MLYLTLMTFVSLPVSGAVPFAIHDELKPVPLCRALENIRLGDHIPIIVSGVYAANYLYDPDELECRLQVEPTTCVTFASGTLVPDELKSLHSDLESDRAFVTFRGILHGPRRVTREEVKPSKTELGRTANRMAAANSALYCGNRYRTKLVVYQVLSFGSVSKGVAWPQERVAAPSDPMPVAMDLPGYPSPGRMIDYEGAVLLAVTVEAGIVTSAEVMFGDPVLVHEAITNVKTWRFTDDVTANFDIQYDFRLEKRPTSQDENPKLMMRLPHYIRVTGPSQEF